MFGKYINTLIYNNVATFILDKKRKEPVKIRYEYEKNKKIVNLFLYFEDWNNFIDFYSKFPEEYKHFYEIIEDECKFFIDLDGKVEEISNDKWYKNIYEIKKITEKIIYEITGKKPIILEFESLYNSNENKYSCHLIVSNIRLPIKQNKILCEIILDNLNIDNKKIIDICIYNNWRSLRLEGSSKVNSSRIKRFKFNNQIIINKIINDGGIVTCLEKTIYFDLSTIFLKNYSKNLYKEEYKKQINNNLKYSSDIKKTYNYNNNDIIFIKNKYREIELFLNKWHDDLNIFYTYKLINNFILYKRNKSANCKICNRVHDSQNPYIFVKYNNIFFDCRRSNSKPIEITNLYKNFNIYN